MASTTSSSATQAVLTSSQGEDQRYLPLLHYASYENLHTIRIIITTTTTNTGMESSHSQVNIPSHIGNVPDLQQRQYATCGFSWADTSTVSTTLASSLRMDGLIGWFLPSQLFTATCGVERRGTTLPPKV